MHTISTPIYASIFIDSYRTPLLHYYIHMYTVHVQAVHIRRAIQHTVYIYGSVYSRLRLCACIQSHQHIWLCTRVLVLLIFFVWIVTTGAVAKKFVCEKSQWIITLNKYCKTITTTIYYKWYFLEDNKAPSLQMHWFYSRESSCIFIVS